MPSCLARSRGPGVATEVRPKTTLHFTKCTLLLRTFPTHRERAQTRSSNVTGVFLLGCAAVLFSPSRKFRRRNGRLRRRGLLEDVTQAVEEVANTAEDALVHVPWWIYVELCGS